MSPLLVRRSGEEQFQLFAAKVSDEAVVRGDDGVGQGSFLRLELEHLFLDRIRAMSR